MKIALITGITGQDGSYLAEFLLEKGYEVHGIVRRSSLINTHRIDHIYDKIKLHYGDLTDSTNLVRIIQSVQPNEIYNLGAQSHVKVSFETPEYTGQVDALGTLRILEAVRLLELEKSVRIYQASTSELYGLVQEIPQKETTPFYPRSPYGVAKLYGFWIIVNYREAYNIFASNGILFNHESPKRGETFVTRKITRAASRIATGMQKKLLLGNMDAKRDWGYAPEYCEGMWKILQNKKADDFVLATGETRTVREFAEQTFSNLGIKITWAGKGKNQSGKIKSIDLDKAKKLIGYSSNKRDYIKDFSTKLKKGDTIIGIDPNYYRPTEVDLLIGDPKKAARELGWKAKTKFEDLVKLMIKSDMDKVLRRGF